MAEALSKDLLLEMINSDITTNGAKNISGLVLNNVLTAIVESMGTAGGGGSYLLPSGMIGATAETPYIFDEDEKVKFIEAVEGAYQIALSIRDERFGRVISYASGVMVMHQETVGDMYMITMATDILGDAAITVIQLSDDQPDMGLAAGDIVGYIE